MNSGFLNYMFSVLLMVLIYQSILFITRIKLNSYLGEFLQSRSGKVLAALLNFVFFAHRDSLPILLFGYSLLGWVNRCINGIDDDR